MRVLTTCLVVFLSMAAFAQGVRGTISDVNGAPLGFATIYVPETGSGTAANADGDYEIALPSGKYTLVFQFLGYETENQSITVADQYRTVNQTLREQTFDLKTVDVISGGENLAYTVMRKAIAKAEYHRQQVEKYSAQVYIKGTGRVLKTPFLFRKMLEEEGIDENSAFVSESVSKIEYERPNTFKETVISYYSRGDDSGSSPASFVNGSFYDPKVAEAISPLSPRAFTFYKFELEGFFVDRDRGVNKIKVIPRSRGENVFEGSIYIIDEDWSIHSLDLTTVFSGIKFGVKQVYAPILDKVWLPVNHNFDVSGKIFGFAFEYKYLAAVSDYVVELNKDLKADFVVIDETVDKERAKALDEENKNRPAPPKVKDSEVDFSQELTRKDLRKLMKEYRKEDREKQEEPEVELIEEYTVDSTAANNDAEFWAEMRPVPLTDIEVRSYAKADSIAVVEAEEKEAEEKGLEGDENVIARNKKKDSKWQFGFGDLLLGSTYSLGEDKRLKLESPLLSTRFNPVEGYVISPRLRYTSNKEFKQFGLAVTPRYSFTRERLSGIGEVDYRFGTKKMPRKTSLSGGRYTYQYHEDGGISSLFNMYLNLFQRENFISLYEKDFARLDQTWQVKPNWELTGGLEYARRYGLENGTQHSWFGEKDDPYPVNNQINREVAYPIENEEDALLFNVGVTAKPWQKYKISNGEREEIDGTSPTLSLNYRKGISAFGSEVDYDHLDFTFRHSFRSGAVGKWDLKANVGVFLNNSALGFADFKHFNGNRIAVTTADPVGSFRLLDYYLHSTDNEYASLHAHYRFRKFLFTQLTPVWMLGIKENLFVNHLATPTADQYTEIGYGLDNIFRVFRVEVAAAFQDGEYLRFGVLVGVAASIGGVTIE